MCHIYSKLTDKVVLDEDVQRFFMGFMALMPKFGSSLYAGHFRGAFGTSVKNRGRYVSYEAESMKVAFYDKLRLICCPRMTKLIVNHYFSGHHGRNDADKVIIELCDNVVKRWVKDYQYTEGRRNVRCGSGMRSKLQAKVMTARIEA